jgi:hypothetical protein
MRRHIVAAGVMVAGSALAASAVPGLGSRQSPPASTQAEVLAVIRQAFHAAYNLDYGEATTLAARSVTLGPDEPQSHRALASVLWMRIIFARGAVTVDHYLGGVAKSQLSLPKPPPELLAAFRRELAQSIALSEARLKRDSADIEARHDVGAAYALQASYQASVEGSVVAAFRSAKRAYDEQEAVLSREPQRPDATFIVGIYRYLVSALSLPARVAAYIVGFGGGKERGIGMLQAATLDADTHVDAEAALVLIYSREGRHLDALWTIRGLEAEFPRNRVFTLEEGSAAIRAGRPSEADVVLTRGLATLDRDDRPKFPGERAVWFLKRGAARVRLNHLNDARADLDTALASAPVEWVRGRIHLELGRVADLTNRRPDALSEYRLAKTVCEANDDPLCANEAGRLIKQAFRLLP